MLVLSFLMVSLYDMNEREVRSMALNDNIKKIREEKKYTQQQLADKLYVSRQTVCRWENGSRCPDLITAKKLAMELGVTLDELISDEDITDIQSKYGIWKFDRVKEREKIQMMQKRILDFIEIIGGIFLAISLLLRVQFDMKVPAWITIISAVAVFLFVKSRFLGLSSFHPDKRISANLWLLHISEFPWHVLSGTFLCTWHLKIGNKPP